MKTTLLVFGFLNQVEKSEMLVATVDCARPGAVRCDGLISNVKMEEVAAGIETFHDGFKLLYLDDNGRPWYQERWVSVTEAMVAEDAIPFGDTLLEREDPESVESVPVF